MECAIWKNIHRQGKTFAVNWIAHDFLAEANRPCRAGFAVRFPNFRLPTAAFAAGSRTSGTRASLCKPPHNEVMSPKSSRLSPEIFALWHRCSSIVKERGVALGEGVPEAALMESARPLASAGIGEDCLPDASLATTPGSLSLCRPVRVRRIGGAGAHSA